MNVISITKLDAARRQLETAIGLLFYDSDPVSIHTLAAAAYDIIDNVNAARGGEQMFVKGRYLERPGTPSKSDINSVQNFFKHADKVARLAG